LKKKSYYCINGKLCLDFHKYYTINKGIINEKLKFTDFFVSKKCHAIFEHNQ